MKRLLLSLCLLTFAFSAIAADSTPAPKIPFTIQLSDGSTAQAVFLPGPNGTSFLVYISNGKLVYGTLVFDSVPVPPTPPTPPPDPPTPPNPPVKGKAAALIVVVDTTASKNQIWTSKEVTDVLKKCNLPPPYVYSTLQVADAKADPTALKWIGKSVKGLLHYPYFFVPSDAGDVLEEGVILDTDRGADLAAKIEKLSATTKKGGDQ